MPWGGGVIKHDFWGGESGYLEGNREEGWKHLVKVPWGSEGKENVIGGELG